MAKTRLETKLDEVNKSAPNIVRAISNGSLLSTGTQVKSSFIKNLGQRNSQKQEPILAFHPQRARRPQVKRGGESLERPTPISFIRDLGQYNLVTEANVELIDENNNIIATEQLNT